MRLREITFEMFRLYFGSPVAFYIHPLVNKHFDLCTISTYHTSHPLKVVMSNLIFVYGTLKQGEPNHYLLENEGNGVKIFCGKAKSAKKFPLVIASRYNIPFVLDCAGTGFNIQGEVYK